MLTPWLVDSAESAIARSLERLHRPAKSTAIDVKYHKLLKSNSTLVRSPLKLTGLDYIFVKKEREKDGLCFFDPFLKSAKNKFWKENNSILDELKKTRKRKTKREAMKILQGLVLVSAVLAQGKGGKGKNAGKGKGGRGGRKGNRGGRSTPLTYKEWIKRIFFFEFY